jgi:hypothetical protein
MVTPDGLSVSLGGGENKELLSLSPVQVAADQLQQNNRRD